MIGTLETGLGEGGYYISKEGYMEQFNDKLSWKPYKGTFNLRLDDDEVPKIEAMKAAEGILINGFQEEGRTFVRLGYSNVLENDNKVIENCAIIFQSVPLQKSCRNYITYISKKRLKR